MQIFLQSRGTDWSALFCASKPACSCIYRDGRCLTDSGMTQPAPVFFYIFSAAVRLHYSWQVHSYYGEKEDDLSYTFSSFCTGCIHHGSISQAAHSRIHPQLWCYPAPLVLQIILISVKLNEGTDSDILMFFTAECLNRYLLVLSYQSYKNSRYLPDQSLTPAIITIRCTTTSLNREMLHQRYDNNYSTF